MSDYRKYIDPNFSVHKDYNFNKKLKKFGLIKALASVLEAEARVLDVNKKDDFLYNDTILKTWAKYSTQLLQVTKLEFDSKFKALATNVTKSKNFETKFSEFSQELYKLISSGKFLKGLKFVQDGKEGISLEIEPELALIIAILELGNSEVPPMRGWNAFEKKLLLLGTNYITEAINNALQKAIIKRLNKEFK